jgi:hypothetical protein
MIANLDSHGFSFMLGAKGPQNRNRAQPGAVFSTQYAVPANFLQNQSA